jgi:hypothetical protein
MSQQGEFADLIYQRLKLGPVSVASLVGEIRDRWGEGHSIESVHQFVIEAMYCLLSHQDVDVGDIAEGQFVSWTIEPLYAYDRIESKLMPLATAFEDHKSIVFQFKGLNRRSVPPLNSSGTYTWIVLCLGERPATLEMIVVTGDAINHAVLDIDELRAGLGWLRARGFVEKTEQRYFLTRRGLLLQDSGNMSRATIMERWRAIESRIKKEDDLGVRYTEPITEGEYEQAIDSYKPR